MIPIPIPEPTFFALVNVENSNVSKLNQNGEVVVVIDITRSGRATVRSVENPHFGDVTLDVIHCYGNFSNLDDAVQALIATSSLRQEYIERSQPHLDAIKYLKNDTNHRVIKVIEKYSDG